MLAMVDENGSTSFEMRANADQLSKGGPPRLLSSPTQRCRPAEGCLQGKCMYYAVNAFFRLHRVYASWLQVADST